MPPELGELLGVECLNTNLSLPAYIVEYTVQVKKNILIL